MGGGDYFSSKYFWSLPPRGHLSTVDTHISKKPKRSFVGSLFRQIWPVSDNSDQERKGKTIIDVDCENCGHDMVVSDDSSVEEVDMRRSGDNDFSSHTVCDVEETSCFIMSDSTNQTDTEDNERFQSVYNEAFLPLTIKEEAEVSRAFSDSNRDSVLVTHADSNIEITGEVFQCLKPGGWLNDEVINLYLELLKEREKREPERFLKCHFFSALFYKRLTSGESGYDFKFVKRWTSPLKIGYHLTECDKLFVPVHKEMHWCLGIINIKEEKFQYLDSLKGMDAEVLKVLARYYVDEVKDKTGEDIDVSCWKQEYVEDVPAQKNWSDCGMFMIKYVDFYSRGLGLFFDQRDIPYFRKRTAKEILRLRAD